MNERKELIERLRLDYTASPLALSLMRQAADMLEADVNWEQVPKPPLTPTSTFQRFDGGKTVQAHTDAAMREYGELCRKQALEEAYKWMLDRHEAQKHRDNYMLVEANRFKKELLTLPRVEQGSVPKQVKPDGSGEVVRTVAWDVVQAKDQPS